MFDFDLHSRRDIPLNRRAIFISIEGWHLDEKMRVTECQKSVHNRTMLRNGDDWKAIFHLLI